MDVAVGIIYDASQRILITQRAAHQTHGGCWEFPGGKVALNETPIQALKREIKEEVGLDIKNHQFLTKVEHNYPQHSVTLWIYQITAFQGIARCLESQAAIRWVEIGEIAEYNFPEANVAILLYLGGATLV